MAQAEHVSADFVSTFRQRFAPLFGRKIARQRAEQYLGGLLCGKAERRNVTSLAGTVDGASARALGWLLNKSPWPTRPIVDALQLYTGNTFGTPDGLFTLNIDNFVKRGDNAVGVERQYVHHQGRISNSQIGVFLAYGSEVNSALVDAAIYMPHSWIDDATRREKAGVPESLVYKTRSALGIELLRQARMTGHLPGEWVTSWHGEGFEPDLRDRLDADGWRYLLPVAADAMFFGSPDAADARSSGDLLAAAAGGSLQLSRVWEPTTDVTRRAAWLLGCRDQLTGAPVAFVSNAPEDDAVEMFERILAARWETARMLAARCAGVSLDVYRVRGWDGWHRHVALALLASVFRSCLTTLPTSLDDEVQPLAEASAHPVTREVSELPAPAPRARATRAPADAVSAAPAPVIPPPMEEEMAVSIDEPAFDAEPAPNETPVASPSAPPLVAVSTTYRLAVDISASEWRAVRAFQVWLVAAEAGTIVESTPTKAEIEREEVGSRVDLRFESTRSREQILVSIEDVPEVVVLEFVADGEAAPAAPASEPTGPVRYDLVVDIHETDWRAVRAFQVWQVADEAGPISSCSPSKMEIERQEVGPQMLIQFETMKSVDWLLTALKEVPEVSVASLAQAGESVPVAAAPAIADAFVVQSEDEHVEHGEADDLLAALQAELMERTTAREAGLMPAFEGPIEVVGNAVIEANIVLEETRELVGARNLSGANGSNGTNGYTNGNGAGSISGLATPTAPPSAPPTESPVRPAAVQPSTAPAETAAGEPNKGPAERPRPAEEQMVVLDVGDESYGIPVKQVREIVRVPPITRVPNGPSFLEGVINLRGQVIPVMDLRKHLGIHGTTETRRSRVVVSELGRHTVGLMVDAVSEVVMISTADIEPPPAIIANGNDSQIRGVARLGDRLVLFLDLDRVLPNS